MKLGIDLGTTRSAIAIVEAGDPTLLQNNTGDRLTPSVVHYGDDDVLVGNRAMSKAKAEPERVVRNIKRHMGEDYAVEIDDEEHTPPEVSSEILGKLKSDAEEYIDEDADEAVITVPAYFTVDQKKATRRAAELAGFDEIELLHEPTSAAISYGYNEDKSETVLVYDFGGGTLDISVMDIDGNDFDMLATGGDTQLGGADFTEAIMDLLADEYEREHGIDIREYSETAENLRNVAEEKKIDLSGNEQTEISSPLMGRADGEVVGITERVVTREEFEDATEELRDRAIDPIREALDKAELDAEDIDSVLLVGGSSKIPSVQDRIGDFFGFEPDKTNDLDRIVAQGAALVADQDDDGIDEGYACPVCGDTFDVFDSFNDHLSADHDPDADTVVCPYCEDDFDTEDDRRDHIAIEHPEELEDGPKIKQGRILTRSLGTDIKGGQMDIVIPHGAELPAEETAKYTTVRDEQTTVPVHVYQGENEDELDENEQLDDWYVSDIPPMDAYEPTIEVTFRIDQDGLLHVSAEETKSGTSATTTVDTSGGDVTPGSGGTEKTEADD